MSLRSFVEWLIPEPMQAKYSFQILEADHKFTYWNLCPYCGHHLTYIAGGWEECEETGLWIVEFLDSDCWSEPDHETQRAEWVKWMDDHCPFPYVYQLPVDERVRTELKQKYRFYFKTTH